MTIRTTLPRAAAVFAVTALTLAGCSANNSETGTADKDATNKSEAAAPGEGDVNIVASTKVWADVARAVTDDPRVKVTEIIQSDDVDPHHFEPTAADMARASEADIVVANGGGYDAWLYEPLKDKNGAKIVHPLELVAHEHSHGHDHDHGEGHDEHEHAEGHEGHAHGEADTHGEHGDVDNHEEHADHAEDHDEHEHAEGHEGHAHGHHSNVDPSGNEHIWYDPETVVKVADDIAQAITEANPEIKTDTAKVDQELNSLHDALHEIGSVRVAQTEPIADHLLKHTDATEVTPAGYRKATLSESEPSAADLAEFLELINSGGLDLLIYNPQTATDLTERIRSAAEDKGVSIVEIPETPKSDTNFLDHLKKTIDELGQASKEAAQH